MAKNVDERVVQLMLDSKEFDKNAKKSINNLDDLKKALEFEGASRGFDNINRAAKKVDFSIMENGIQRVQNHFNLLESVANTVTERITNKVIDAGERMIKSLSVDQVSSGWDQYADRTVAVQRIMSATSQQFENQEVQLGAVNKQLEKLTWFTDETSYKFLDIVNSIGKFTANNIELEKSVRAMEGISTWASLSGASINEAGRAMYNLAQSMSVGYVMLMDWRSIQNANMATYEFQQTAIQTAVAMNMLTDAGDGMYRTLNGKVFSATQLFSDGLQHAWFSADVLMTTLEKYGGFTDLLNAFMSTVENAEFLTFDALQMIDSYIEGNLDMNAAMEQTGLSAEVLSTYLEQLASDEMELGRKGFKAAQETKTFGEAIDYIKTAVSSGWAKSFEYIFGDYLEAKDFWSELSERLYEVFVRSGEVRNEMLALWKALGGRDVFVEALWTLWDNVAEIFKTIGKAWDSIFGKSFEGSVATLLNLTNWFFNLASSIKVSEGSLSDIVRILESVFRVLNVIKNAVRTVFRALEPVGRLLNRLSGTILYMVANLMELFSIKIEKIFDEKGLNRIYNIINLISTVIEYIGTVGISLLMDVFGGLTGIIDGFFTAFEATSGGIEGIFTALIDTIKMTINNLASGDGLGGALVSIIQSVFAGLVGGAQFVMNQIIAIFTGEKITGENFGDMSGWLESISNTIESLKLEEKFQSMVGMIGVFSAMLQQFVIDLQDADSAVRVALRGIGDELMFVWEWFKGVLSGMTPDDVAKLGMVIVLAQLVSSMVRLNNGLTSIATNTGKVIGTLNDVIMSFTNLRANSFMEKLTVIFNKTKIVQIGIAALMLAAAFNELNKLDYSRTIQSAILLGGVLGVLLVAFNKWETINTRAMKNRKKYGTDAKQNAVGLIILEISGAIYLLSQAVSSMANVLNNPDMNLGKLVVIIGALAAGFVGLQFALDQLGKVKDIKNINKAASALILVATAFTAMTIPVLAMSYIPWDQMKYGLIGVGSMLLAVGAACFAMQKTNWKTIMAVGAAMTGLAAGLTLMSLAVVSFGLAEQNGLGGGIANTIISVAALGAAIALLGNILKGVEPGLILSISAAFLALSGAVLMLAGAGNLMRDADMEAVGTAILGLSAALGILVAILSKLPGSEKIINAVGSALLKFGAAVALVGVGVTLLTVSIAAFAVIMAALGRIGEEFGDDFPKYINKGFDAFEVIVERFLDMIPKYSLKIATAVGTIMAAVSAGIYLSKHKTAASVVAVGMEIISTLLTFGDPIIDTLVALLEMLGRRVPELVEAAKPLAYGLGNGIIDLLWEVILGGISGIIGAIDDVFGSDLQTAFEESLGRGAQGIRKGSEYVKTESEDTGKEGGKAFEKGWRDAVGDRSPWKLTEDSVRRGGEGIVRGGERYMKPAAETTGDTVAQGMVDHIDTTLEAGLGNTAKYVANKTDEIVNAANEKLAKIDGFSGGGRGDFGDRKRSDTNLIDTSDKKIPTIWNSDLVAKMKGELEDEEDDPFAAIKQKLADLGEGLGTDLGTNIGSGVGKGLSGAGRSAETKKSAEDYAKSVLDAIKTAYDDGIKALDTEESLEELNYKLWDLRQPKTTEQEQKAYEAAKKQKDIDRLDQQFMTAISKAELANRRYLTTLETFGGEAEKTMEAYQNMLESRVALVELQSKRNELTVQQSESNADAFIQASKDISNYYKLVKDGLITEQMALDAAQNRLKEWKPTEPAVTNSSAATEAEIQKIFGYMDGIEDLMSEKWYELGTFAPSYSKALQDGSEEAKWNTVKTFSDAIEAATLSGVPHAKAEGVGQDVIKGYAEGLEKDKEARDAAAKAADNSLDSMAEELEIKSPSKATDRYGQYMTLGLANGLLNDGAVSRLMNAADEISRKLLARLKAKLGVNSPSTEGEWITKMVDYGMVNGLEKYGHVVQKSGDRLVENLLNSMEDTAAQNGSEFQKKIQDILQLSDDDMHLRVVIDADDTSLNRSMSLLESLGGKRQIFLGGQFSGVNLGAQEDDNLRRIAENDVYRAKQLQNLYDLLGDYIDLQRTNSVVEKGDKQEQKPMEVTYNQYNTSPKPISSLDTYRNTRKQLNSFATKFGGKVKK